MKKLLVLTLTALSITALVGCSAKNEKVDNGQNSNTIVQANESEMLFAKVKKVVGNEISIKLSDNSFGIPEGEEGSMTTGTYTIDVNGGASDVSISGPTTVDPNAENNVSSDGGIVEFAEAIPLEDGAMDLPDGAMVFEADSDDSNMFSEIEFNGEERDLIIPAGVEIFNVKTGKAGNVSDIKEGSILSIVMDSESNTVTRIDIMG